MNENRSELESASALSTSDAESYDVENADETLVAYLDGELSPQESEAIDKRLANDSAYRDRLRELQHAWDMLDLVPRPSVQEEFTRSTVEMIAVTAADEARRSGESRRRLRWLWRAAAALAILACGVGGYAIASWLIDRPNQQLLADLPLLVDLNLYRSAESTEFLSQLEKRRLFSDEQHASETEDQAANTSPLAALTLATGDDARREALGKLPTADLNALRSKKTQFDSLDAAEQQRLRTLYRDIARSPSSQEYRQLMERYSDWLKTISSGERAELRDLAGDAKVERVDQLLKAQQAERFKQLSEGGLAEEDLDKISVWIDGYLHKHESELLASVSPEMRRRFEAGDPAARKRLLALAVFRPGRGLRIPKFDVVDFVSLTDSLSPEAKDAWTKTSEADRSQLAQRWIAAAFWSKGPPLSDKQLREFYQSLDAKPREWLDRLPPERMTSELRKLYYARQFQREGMRREFPRGFPAPVPPPGEATPPGDSPSKRKLPRADEETVQ